MASMQKPLFVRPEWLKEELANDKSDSRIVDGSWHLPMWKRDAAAEYLSDHIVGAVRFNIDEIADKSASIPRTCPSSEQFEEQVGKMGISNSTHVIVYDNNANLGMFSAARVWFMFRLYGHDNVSILEGGLPQWTASGGKTVSGPQAAVEPAVFKAKYRPDLYRTFEETLEAYTTKKEKILDARSPGRFEGKDPEPNPKVPSGRIIGTENMFWRKFFTPEKVFKPKVEVQQVFDEAGISLDEPYITSCGSGLSACWLNLAAFVCGKELPLFDGSWLEWHKRGPEETKVLGVKGEDLK